MECFKLGLVGHLSRNMEDIRANGDLKCGGLALEAYFGEEYGFFCPCLRLK